MPTRQSCSPAHRARTPVGSFLAPSATVPSAAYIEARTAGGGCLPSAPTGVRLGAERPTAPRPCRFTSNEDVAMAPEELAAHLSSLEAAADVVEAIDDPETRRHRGWNLSGWSYEMIPWG